MTKTAPHRSLHAASGIRSKKAAFIVADRGMISQGTIEELQSTERPVD